MIDGKRATTGAVGCWAGCFMVLTALSGACSPSTPAAAAAARDASAAENGGGAMTDDGGGAGGAIEDAGTPAASGAEGGVPDARPGLVNVPSSPAGEALTWLLALLDGPSSQITPAAVASHFSAAFLQQIPADTLVPSLVGLSEGLSPATLRQIESSSPGSAASPASTVAAIVETGDHLFIRITIVASAVASANAVFSIDGLLFSPAPEHDLALRDPAVLDARLGTVAPIARLLVARLDGEACVPVHALRAEEAMPLGSMFKLYVLGALAADVDSGRTAWTDPVTIEEAWKSLPSGVLQDLPAGTVLSVEEVAGKMISISDNTAADHLLHLVGRERVEAHQLDMGNANAALNVPFLSTRELFELKLGATAAERATFLAAAPEARRTLLESDYDARPLPDLAVASAFTTPLEIDRLEWFASAIDVCHAFAALKGAADRPTGAPVANILAMNPGIPPDPTTFSYVGYKGGSEPGVLALGWLLHRISDGAWMVVSLGFENAGDTIDESLGAYYGLAAVQMAGR